MRFRPGGTSEISRWWNSMVSAQILKCVFPAAVPPDLRKRLCPSDEAAYYLLGYAPNRARVGIAQEIIGVIHSGRLKTSRTSGGKAAGKTRFKICVDTLEFHHRLISAAPPARRVV